MNKTEKIIISLLTIALGIAFIVKDPGFIIGYAATAIGVFLCITGGYDYAKGDTLKGIIKAVVGALLVFFPWLMANILIYVFAGFLIVLGLLYLFGSLGSKLKGLPLLLVLLVGIFYIVVGVLIIVNAHVAQGWIIYVMGALLIIDGAISLLDALTTKEKKGSRK